MSGPSLSEKTISALDQFGGITTFRNDLLHYQTFLDEGTYAVVNRATNPRKTKTSIEILKNATFDCKLIQLILVIEVLSNFDPNKKQFMAQIPDLFKIVESLDERPSWKYKSS